MSRHAASARDLSTLISRFDPKWLKAEGGLERLPQMGLRTVGRYKSHHARGNNQRTRAKHAGYQVIAYPRIQQDPKNAENGIGSECPGHSQDDVHEKAHFASYRPLGDTRRYRR